MNLNFINSDNDENIINNIEDLILTEFNPRFFLIKNLNDNLIDLFKLDLNSEKKQQEIANKILKFEGDFSEFIELLESIYRDDFDNTTEPILLVKNLNGKFVVAEGNRRILALKLINEKLILDDFSNVVDKFNGYEDSISDFTLEMNDDFDIKTDDKIKYQDMQRKRYLLCLELLDKIKNKYKQFDIHYKIIKNEDELWKLIYDKHLVGIRPGMRKWSRSKYFADLLIWFVNFHEFNNDKKDNFLNNLSKKINRNVKKIKEDYMQAQLSYCFLYFGKYYYLDDIYYNKESTFHKPTNNVNMQIVNELLSIEHPSALEKVHSYNKVRTISCSSDFLNINKDDFNSNYHEIKFDDNLRIILIDKKIKTDDIFKFIYNSWKDGIITTRGIKEKDISKFYSDLKEILGIEIKPKFLSENEINKINEFSFDIEKLESIIKLNEYRFPIQIIRFKEALKIKKNNLNFIRILEKKFPENKNKIEPIKVFNILYEQLKYVSKKNFLNAIASTLRSIIEQIIVWFWAEMLNDDKSKEEHIKEIYNNEKIGNIVIDKRRKFNTDHDLINKFIDISCNLDDKNKSKMIDFFGKLFIDLNDPNNMQNSLYTKILNNFIHASHKIYIETSYENNLKSLNYILENIIVFVENMFIDKIKYVNDKIVDIFNIN